MAERGETHFDPQACPVCGLLVNAAVHYSPTGVAAPGDWTVCSGCLAWLVFGEHLALRVVSDREWMALTSEDQARRTAQQQAVRHAFERAPRQP